MLSRAQVNDIQPVARVEALLPVTPAGHPKDEAFTRAMQNLLGRQIQGEVLSRLQDGSFLVRLVGHTARMMLPPGSQIGQSLSLKLISLEPRPTFLTSANTDRVSISPTGREFTELSKIAEYKIPVTQSLLKELPQLQNSSQFPSNSAHSNNQSGAANAAQIPSQMMAQKFSQMGQIQNIAWYGNQTPDAILNTEEARNQQISPLGQAIARLLQSTSQTLAAKALQTQSPLLSTTSIAPENIANAMRDTLTFSGIFYESHMAQWIEGKRTLTELLREPQAQHDPSNLPGKEALLSDPTTTGKSDAGNIARADLVNLQLNVLEHQQVRWHGEIWPGQKMDWEISKEDQGNAAPGEATETWQSTVRFELPTLGTIAATIAMTGDRLRIQISTATETAVAPLTANAQLLTDALNAIGSHVDGFMVKQDESI